MNVHNNDPESFIDDPEDFHQYCSWLLSVYKGNTLHPTATQVRTSQLDGGSNSHMFTNITMLSYTRHVKFNVKILNGIKTPANVLAFS